MPTPRYTKVQSPSFHDDEERNDEVMTLEERSGILQANSVPENQIKRLASRTLVALLVVALTALFSFEFMRSRAPAKISSTPKSCGNSTSEARAMGCEFDVLSYTWLPKECIDYETISEFRDWIHSKDRQFSEWPFYADREGKQWIPDEVRLSEFTWRYIWTTKEEHLGHCAFMSRRLHRAALGNFRLYVRGDGVHHTIHCSEMLLDNINEPVQGGGLLPAHLGISFGTC